MANIIVKSVCKKCGNTFTNPEGHLYCPECRKYMKFNNKVVNYKITTETPDGYGKTFYVDETDYENLLTNPDFNVDTEMSYLNKEYRDAIKRTYLIK